MLRNGLVFGALLACGFAVQSADVQAQNRSWVPWNQIGGGSSNSSNGGSVFQQSAPQSSYQYPELIQGGARPDISPEAPQTVAFNSGYSNGTIIIDNKTKSLFYVLSSNSAYRYPISVGREGFRWRGTEKISRVAAWPDWHPPEEMRERDPRLPIKMTGGVNNPLGAKALYLGNTLYRIHGTNDERTIGYAASSGCFRMMNHHVVHLAQRAGPGTTVVVVDRLPGDVRVGAVDDNATKSKSRS